MYIYIYIHTYKQLFIFSIIFLFLLQLFVFSFFFFSFFFFLLIYLFYLFFLQLCFATQVCQRIFIVIELAFSSWICLLGSISLHLSSRTCLLRFVLETRVCCTMCKSKVYSDSSRLRIPKAAIITMQGFLFHGNTG